MEKTIERLERMLREGESIDLQYSSGKDKSREWSGKVSVFLRERFGPDEQESFDGLSGGDVFYEHGRRLGHLQGLVAKAESVEEGDTSRASALARASELSGGPVAAPKSRKVFVVHGHDTEAKETAARFLGNLQLEPIILHEQPSSGRTLIEKFEVYSGDIAFAVVLLTPDDVGCSASNPDDLQKRARQNVILELGYFMGRLGRARVCALYKGGLELPSDYQGVLYIEMDAGGAWKPKLAQELVDAKLPIDLAGLLS
jgi:predicted nucleotide-binding protein